MEKSKLLGIASDLIGIIGFIVAGIATINHWIDTLRRCHLECCVKVGSKQAGRDARRVQPVPMI